MHCKRNLVPSRKQAAYQLPRTQGSLSSHKRVPRPLPTQVGTCSNRQHHSGVIHKQGRRHEVGPTLCFTQVFNFVGYQFDLKEGKIRPTPGLDRQNSILFGPVCPFRQFMSLIGLLTATEKQVHLGRLHMRLIQWHLKNNWRVPESLEKVIPVPMSLHPHLKWWLEESNVLPGQPLHPLKHALQIFTDAKDGGALT